MLMMAAASRRFNACLSITAARSASFLLIGLLTGSGSMVSSNEDADGSGPRHQKVERMAILEQVEGMYDHAFGSYMTHAFPADELRPLSCDGRLVRERGDLDALLGNYSMTVIDSLDSLVIFNRLDDFADAVAHVAGPEVHFKKDLLVSTFELNIRALGGLLSGHMHAVRLLPKYKGELLTKAKDLATRLARAFETPTGMPRSRVNLLTGASSKSSVVTMAEAGSFLLEFGVLTLLTGESKWYDIAKRSLLSFWQRRSSLNLVGTSADVETGEFKDFQSTTGPGQDSFFEYLLKGYILFDDLELLEMFHQASAAVDMHLSFEGFTYNVDSRTTVMSNTHLSPLSCVWGSLQVLLGNTADALRAVLYWFSLWSKYEALPEVFDTKTEAPTQARDSPLRPELIEAMYYLSRALPDDPEILKMATKIARALKNQSRVKCGYASVADVTTGRLDDRMDSFFLSETLVYLYLTLAPEDRLKQAAHWPVTDVVFSTEGHMFPLPRTNIYATSKIPGLTERLAELYPEASERPILTCDALSPLERTGVQGRCASKYIMTPGHHLEVLNHSPRSCRAQTVSVTASTGRLPPLEFEGMIASFGPPGPALPISMRSVNGNDDGRPVTSLGACSPSKGNCSALPGGPLWPGALAASGHGLGLSRLDLERPAGQQPPFNMGAFGSARPGSGLLAARELFATRRAVLAEPLDACTPLEVPAEVDKDSSGSLGYYEGRVIVAERGNCLFIHKLNHLQQVHAKAVVIVNRADGGELQVMSSPLQDKGAGIDLHTLSVMVSQQDGEELINLIRIYGRRNCGVRVRIAAPV
eukprot:TRINITY_DN12980_c0_g1_i4.p1 TRINITY_DN12980_c0_g1~~TRINITY_DN12980_c0_g1_i4.p1  ORF type:complete len:814 (+),score=131.31 TRINITY_DN12980_c0_g1_i4:153-2594(+)